MSPQHRTWRARAFIRRKFWDRTRQELPNLEIECQSLPPVGAFQHLLEKRAIAPLLGKLCFEITEWFEKIPMRLPET